MAVKFDGESKDALSIIDGEIEGDFENPNDSLNLLNDLEELQELLKTVPTLKSETAKVVENCIKESEK